MCIRDSQERQAARHFDPEPACQGENPARFRAAEQRASGFRLRKVRLPPDRHRIAEVRQTRQPLGRTEPVLADVTHPLHYRVAFTRRLDAEPDQWQHEDNRQNKREQGRDGGFSDSPAGQALAQRPRCDREHASPGKGGQQVPQHPDAHEHDRHDQGRAGNPLGIPAWAHGVASAFFRACGKPPCLVRQLDATAVGPPAGTGRSTRLRRADPPDVAVQERVP